MQVTRPMDHEDNLRSREHKYNWGEGRYSIEDDCTRPQERDSKRPEQHRPFQAVLRNNIEEGDGTPGTPATYLHPREGEKNFKKQEEKSIPTLLRHSIPRILQEHHT